MASERDREVKSFVLQKYSEVAKSRLGAAPGASSSLSCCGGKACSPQGIAAALGYSTEEIAAGPDGANLGLSCGNPLAIAEFRPGETVLDLGSGGGFDCFLAARKVGPEGRVIGVDMTPEMTALARENAVKWGVRNVSFQSGEIEHLPVPDATVDVIISNCVINLAPDKRAVYREAFRVLRPGGRLAISDVVATRELPEGTRNDPALWSSCLAGALLVADLRTILAEIGYHAVAVDLDAGSREQIREWLPGSGLEEYVASARIRAVKPN
jgi:SAM-dependent methyltransferase